MTYLKNWRQHNTGLAVKGGPSAYEKCYWDGQFDYSEIYRGLIDLKNIDVEHLEIKALLRIPQPLLYNEYYRLLMKHNIRDTEDLPDEMQSDKERLDIITVINYVNYLADYDKEESKTLFSKPIAEIIEIIKEKLQEKTDQIGQEFKDKNRTFFSNIYEYVFSINGNTTTSLLRKYDPSIRGWLSFYFNERFPNIENKTLLEILYGEMSKIVKEGRTKIYCENPSEETAKITEFYKNCDVIEQDYRKKIAKQKRTGFIFP